MNLYPNPAGGFIHLNWEGATSEERIYIYNSQGKLMMVHDINDGIKTTTIDIKNLSTGLYFLRFDGVSKSFSKQ